MSWADSGNARRSFASAAALQKERRNGSKEAACPARCCGRPGAEHRRYPLTQPTTTLQAHLGNLPIVAHSTPPHPPATHFHGTTPPCRTLKATTLPFCALDRHHPPAAHLWNLASCPARCCSPAARRSR